MTLKTAIKTKNVPEIRKITKTLPLADIADLLESLDSAELIIFFRLLKTETQSEIFAHLESEYQESLIRLFTEQQMKDIVGELYSDEIADLIEEMPDDMASRILKSTDSETRAVVNKLLQYDEHQTGSIMNVDIIIFKQSQTIGEAIQQLKSQKEDVKIAHNFFITDSKKRLVGKIAVEDLIFEKNSTKLSAIIKPTASVTTTTDKEQAALEFANQDMTELPVINSNKEVVGMITSDEVIDVVTEEATEDIQKMAGIEVMNDVPYSKSKTIDIFKSRTLWLMLLMLSATISQIVLEAFQGFSSDLLTISLTTMIVAILPVISGAAGNAGSQSSTTVIRALATGDITTKDYLKVVWKELKVSVIIGLALGIANFLRLIIYYAADRGLDNEYIFLSLAASLALFVVIVLAKITGGTLPILAKKLKLDPAVMAAPLLTTLIDALSTMIFFGISIGIMYIVI